jgi:hypothetical protein
LPVSGPGVWALMVGGAVLIGAMRKR